MAGDPRKRFEEIMNKLSRSAAPLQKKTNPLSSSDGIGWKTMELGIRVSNNCMGSVGVRQCRPWDRGDLMKRLATFKAMTWFGKPKAISPVNCASRGWINVEMDVISCEACGARLLFSTPSSWSLHQVEKAAAVFSLKLDNGHKLLCPWINNACDEKLALFQPTPPPALVDSYNERSAALLRLTALPIISSSAIDYMKSPELELLLSQSSSPPVSLNNGIKLTDNPESKAVVSASENAIANTYYQAQKTISLCGWEACLLPYVVDNEDQPYKSSGVILGEQKSSSIICTSGIGEVEWGNEPSLSEQQYDPASVVLDCKFCGARVGLWAFATVPRPLESFIIVADPNSQNESATRCTDLVKSLETSRAESSGKDYQNSASTSTEKPLVLNLTIAGGPPPTKQNFRPVVSFPIISRHLRAEFASASSEFSSENHEKSEFHSQVNVSSQQQTDENSGPAEGAGSLKRKRTVTADNVNSEEIMHDSDKSDGISKGVEENGEHMEREFSNNVEAGETVCTASNSSVIIRDSEPSADNAVMNFVDVDNSNGNSILEIDPLNAGETSKHDDGGLSDIASCSAANAAPPCNKSMETGKADRSELKKLENARTNNQANGVALPSAGMKENTNHGLGNIPMPSKDYKSSKFDPIRQHRPFCPWIAEDGESLPGWRLTLNALARQDKDSSSDAQHLNATSTSTNEMDDPIVSIRKLFMSPPAKRSKGAH